ncbi:MAG: helix-turn-helix transcriptional regulator [Clostridia bacterium]|nr:helix-turn-helix transcriptional regulator [Clostridia bacterium]
MRQKNLRLSWERNYFTNEPSYHIQRQNYISRDNKVKNICVFHWLQYDSAKHNHDYIELAYVISGKMVHYIGDERVILGKGDFIFVNYDDVHQYKLHSGKTAYIINCAFLPRFLNPMLDSCRDLGECLASHPFYFLKGMLNADPGRFVFKDDKQKRIRNLLEDMIKEYDTSDIGSEEILRSHLNEIIIHAMRQITDRDVKSRDDLILRVLQYGKENIKVPDLSINKFAEKEGMSRQYLSRRFKLVTGKTFTDYLRGLRINLCCGVLSATDRPITEIAEEAGYRDMNTFYKHFKIETGMSPSEYKKSLNQ